MKAKPKICFPCVLHTFLTLQVNVLAPFCIIHTFLPDLIDQKVSNIVNISSLIAYLPSSRLSFFHAFSLICRAYSASKAALSAMSNCLRLEMKVNHYDHIRVSTVCPQFVTTGMFAGAYQNESDPRCWLMMHRHLGHFIKECVFPDNKPEDIAREIVHAITHEKEEIILPVGTLS